MPSSFNISQSFADSAGPTYKGSNSFSNNSGVTAIQFSGNNIGHNANVVPGNCPNNANGAEVTIYADGLVAANVIGLGFVCSLLNINGNTGTPQSYIKLKGANGSSHDLVIPLTPGQAFAWSPPTTVPVIGAGNAVMTGVALAANITSITVVPDPISDMLIQGTIDILS